MNHPAALLLPAPRLAEERDGILSLSDGAPVTVASPDLLPLADLLVESLHAATGVRPSAPRTGASAPGGIHLLVEPSDEGIAAIPPARGVSPDGSPLDTERFSVLVDPDGAGLVGSGAAGLHHATTVFRALAEQSPRQGSALSIPAVRILDGPALAWRGLSFDVVRNAFSRAEVLRVIDLLERYRMNVLHLHLTDEQGWRLEIPSRPALTPPGTPYFSEEDFSAIVAHASARHITVVPEIDMPGHSGAAIAAYPELSPTGIAQPVIADPMEATARMAAEDFAPQFLDPRKDEVWAFVDEVIGAVAARTPGPYLHIGGDEAFGMPQELHDAFVTRTREIVRAHGKEPVGWQETVRSAAEPGELVQLWIGEDPLPDAGENPFFRMLPPRLIDMLATTFGEAGGDPRRMIAQRARVIMSRTDVAYLDAPYAEPSAEPEEEALRSRLGLPTYPAVTIESVATARIPGFDEDSDLDIIGFEAAIWCETVQSFDDLTFLLLPRLPALAQRAWDAGPARPWEDLRPRLAAQEPLWRRDGLAFFAAPSVRGR
ncbi:family 20 glycosylhydrolase [Microbacterium sp. NPDC089698]|uniref:family 20 glycosylhydrolase n=1 Tax=Microbacterium sp. NPDC089698 TaxID=3364200 RepID=UPI00380CC038